MPGIKKELMDITFNKLVDDRAYATIRRTLYLYAHLPKCDPMLQLMVDAFCIHEGVKMLSSCWIDLAHELPQDFLVRMLLKLNKLSTMEEEEKRLKREDYVEKE